MFVVCLFVYRRLSWCLLFVCLYTDGSAGVCCLFVCIQTAQLVFVVCLFVYRRLSWCLLFVCLYTDGSAGVCCLFVCIQTAQLVFVVCLFVYRRLSWCLLFVCLYTDGSAGVCCLFVCIQTAQLVFVVCLFVYRRLSWCLLFVCLYTDGSAGVCCLFVCIQTAQLENATTRDKMKLLMAKLKKGKTSFHQQGSLHHVHSGQISRSNTGKVLIVENRAPSRVLTPGRRSSSLACTHPVDSSRRVDRKLVYHGDEEAATTGHMICSGGAGQRGVSSHRSRSYDPDQDTPIISRKTASRVSVAIATIMAIE